MTTQLELLHASAALSSGERRALARWAASGRLVRIAHGAYAAAAARQEATPGERLVARTRAAALHRPDRVFAGLSAAALWGLPIVVRGDAQAEIAAVESSGGRSGPGVRARHMEGEPVEAERDGIRCTSLEQTLADVAMWHPPETSVPALDAGLRSTSRDAIRAVAAARPRRGHARQRIAIAFADADSGSPGESLSRVTIARLGLPAPVLQREFHDEQGFVGAVDFCWPELGIAGEFDGRVKYVDPAMLRGRDAAEVVMAEKHREDRLRRQLRGVARWTWADAWSRSELGAILRAAGLVSEAARPSPPSVLR